MAYYGGDKQIDLTEPGSTGEALAPIIIRTLYATMVFAALAGALEWAHMSVIGSAVFVEKIALITVEIGFASVLVGLILWNGIYLAKLALAVFVGAIIYICTMVGAAMFLADDPGRAVHTAMWLHPAFIALALTQSTMRAQLLCWASVMLIGGLAWLHWLSQPISFFASADYVSFGHLVLSLSASSSLLYALSAFREMQGADQARIAAMQRREQELRESAELLRTANDAAARSSRVMLRFLNNISHELRTPLNGIIGFSEIIRDEMLGAHTNEKYKEYGADISGSGAHLLDLVNDLIFYSNLNAGRFVPYIEQLDVGLLLRSVAQSLAQLAEKSGLTIALDDSAGAFPVIDADPLAMRQILRCLVTNAIKFSGEGGRIMLGARLLDSGACELSVSDTGVGIPVEEQAEIFELFQKGEQGENAAVRGVGLGLATVKSLVDMHDGEVRLQSVEGEGTCVTVTIPLVQSADRLVTADRLAAVAD